MSGKADGHTRAARVRDALNLIGYTDKEIAEVAAKPSPPYASRFLDACREATLALGEVTE